jgi:hypothetical protein
MIAPDDVVLDKLCHYDDNRLFFTTLGDSWPLDIHGFQFRAASTASRVPRISSNADEVKLDSCE